MSATISTSQSLVASSTSGAPPDPTNTTNTPPASQATLYLYTFLVTLVVLFALTGGIVARSCFIRRRSRLRMEEAVRNGTFVPPSRRPKLGEKPTLHDVDLEKLHEENAINAPDVWSKIRPVALILSDASKSKSGGTRTSPSHSSTSVNVIDWFRPTLIRQEVHHSSTSEKEKDKVAPQPSEETSASAQVTFLVAMPVPNNRPETRGDGDSAASSSTASDTKKVTEIPLMDFGILEATVKDPFTDAS